MTVAEDDLAPLDTLDQLWPKWLELKEPIEHEYAATMAPVRKARTQQLADLERDFAAKMQQAKADLYQAQRRFKETQYALKRWKDSTARVIEQDYRNVQVRASATRRRKIAPIQSWFDRERPRLLKKAHDEQERQQRAAQEDPHDWTQDDAGVRYCRRHHTDHEDDGRAGEP